eukprot:scaffold18003_cov146-Isochrysis_galbana.AAC.3
MAASGGRAGAVASLVTALIEVEVPAPGADDEDRDRLLQYAMRLLGSSMSSSARAGFAQSSELARRRLVQAGRTDDALAMSERLQRLAGASARWRNLPAALQLLTCLMQSAGAVGRVGYGAGTILCGGRASSVQRPAVAPTTHRLVAPEPAQPSAPATAGLGAGAPTGVRRLAANRKLGVPVVEGVVSEGEL